MLYVVRGFVDRESDRPNLPPSIRAKSAPLQRSRPRLRERYTTMVSRSGLPGLPFAVSIASWSNVPPFTSQAPGSSQIAHGHPTSPMAVFPFEPITLKRVFVCLWTIPIRVWESRKRYPPRGFESFPREAKHDASLLDRGRAKDRFRSGPEQGIPGVEDAGEQVPGERTFPIPARQRERGRVDSGRGRGPDKAFLEGSKVDHRYTQESPPRSGRHFEAPGGAITPPSTPLTQDSMCSI